MDGREKMGNSAFSSLHVLGMTLADYFVGQMLAGPIGQSIVDNYIGNPAAAARLYDFAELLVAEKHEREEA